MKTLYKNNISKFLLLGLTATLITACGGSKYTENYDTATGEPIELGSDNPICKEGLATQEGQIIDNKTNKGLSDVTVEIAGCTMITDKNGYYKFSNIPSKKRTSVNFEKNGYTSSSQIISINEDTSNYLESSLNKNRWSWSFNSEAGTKGGTVIISANTKYTDNNDKSYTGEISAHYTYQDTNTPEGRDSFPGTYQGIDLHGSTEPIPFVSYGFIVLDLKDKDNNTLNISQPISIKFKNIKETEEETISLWFYNEDRGIWIEKGYAEKDENGNYTCEISNTGTWSLSKPIETEMGRYKGTIVDVDENPISNVRIEAVGKNWITKDLTTDENGEFEVFVVPNQTFTISAYDYKEKFGAEFEDSLPAIASGDIVQE